MSEKLANGSFKGKKIKTISLTQRQHGLRVNLGERGNVVITRDIDGYVIFVEASPETELCHYDHDGVRACKIELTKPE